MILRCSRNTLSLSRENAGAGNLAASEIDLEKYVLISGNKLEGQKAEFDDTEEINQLKKIEILAKQYLSTIRTKSEPSIGKKYDRRKGIKFHLPTS